MDTAQRNMGLDAAATRELISRSAQVAREEGGSVVVGVNTDHVEAESISIAEIIDAYKEQLHFTEEQGAGPVLMASRHLARAAQSRADYLRVYGAVLQSATTPVVLHWLGTAFDPALQGYFGSDDWSEASDVLLRIIAENPGKVAGVKMSLLDAAAEVAVRERLPEGVRMYTGDDFNYVGLIGGADGARRGAARSQPGRARVSTPTPSSARSPRSLRWLRPPFRRSTPATPRGTSRSSARPKSSAARSSPRRPSTTRRASRSCRG